MAVAEDTGLVVELDSWVIDSAVAQIARWTPRRAGGRRGPARFPLPWIAVNVSARSVAHPRVVARLHRRARGPGFTGAAHGRCCAALLGHDGTLPHLSR